MAERQQRMTDEERARIVRLRKEGLSYTALQERFRCSRETLYKIVRDAEKVANAQG